MPDNINQAIAGLNLDSASHQIEKGWLTYAYNAVVENFDGNSITYQNEQGNTYYIAFPEGYKLIGVKNVPELKQVYYFLTNPTTTDSEIGYSNHGIGVYNTLINDTLSEGKFNFSIEFPIHQVIPKTTNCSTQLYWTEGLRNNPRYIDLTELPWVEVRNPSNDFKPTKIIGQLDPNKLRVQPDFKIPEIQPEEVSTGGNLQMGTYQFCISYANSLGEDYTSYFSVTNPTSIWEDKVTQDFDLPTSKAIKLHVSNLDTSGIYDYFNIAVIKTVNQIPSVYLVGTFPIISNTHEFVYTGVEVSPKQLSIEEILTKHPYYDMAEIVYEVDHCIGWGKLYTDDEINYQKIWNEVDLLWETYQLPYNQFEGYIDGVNSALYRSYMRDEVYPVEGFFLLSGGRQTKSFHIPGRAVKASDLEIIYNNDVIGNTDPCEENAGQPRWRVYNTGTAFQVNPNVVDDPCYIGPYQQGELAYWESIRNYPNNPEIWGARAGKPITHPKLPDNIITPHFSNNPTNDKSFTHYIYPIGFKVRMDSLQLAIKQSNLTQAQKDDIVGFGIARGNRAGGQASVQAKGIFMNVGRYTFEDKNYYYPNYPYNDLRPDPFFSREKLQDHAGYRPTLALDGFKEWAHSRFTFHSPDTHFDKPFIGDVMKIEGLLHGKSYGHFVKVENNAEYKLMTREAYMAAAAVAISSGITLGVGTFGTPSYSLTGVPAAYQSMIEILEKIMPYNNFGYSFNSIGFYNNFVPVPNDGDKIRHISTGKYIVDGFQGAEQGTTINNFRRESSVFIRSGDIPFPHEYPQVTGLPIVPVDNSRYTITSYSSSSSSSFIDFFNLFVYSGTMNITNQFIEETMAAVSTVDAPLHHFEQTGSTHTGPLTVGTIYNDIYGNIYRVRFEYMYALSPLSYHFWAELITKGSQSFPVATAGTLTLDPSNTVPTSLTTVMFGRVLEETSSSYYGRSPGNMADYVSKIRAILLTYAGNQSLIDTPPPSTLSPHEAWLVNQASATYYAAYGDYVAGLPKLPALKERDADISCYYGSLKRNLLDQWGQMYSYETISTGYYQELRDQDGQLILDYPTIFGGDTFINQFTFKSKVPFFISNTVSRPNGADINYDELGNYGHPTYWLSTKPIDIDIDISEEARRAAAVVLNPSAGDWALNVLQGGGHTAHAGGDVVEKVFEGIIKVLGIKNTNLDNFSKKNMYEEGIMYLFAYGLPTYFVESAINVDHRQAINETWGNFYPHVGNEIPDNWLQEVVTPIIHDNNYTYNFTYSKQNKEVFFTHLREDFDPEKKCFTQFPNRTFWSDRSQLEEFRNNWLIYRSASYYDFPKAFGALTSIDSLENNSVLVRFENKSQVYNSMQTIDTSLGTAFIGSNKLFSEARPIDLSHTDVGSAGSQHKFLLRTDYGAVYVDSIRGQVLITDGNKVEDIGQKKVNKFLQEHLPFVITQEIPNAPIDNHFLGIGITGVYIPHKRLIITKLDYRPLQPTEYRNGIFYETATQTAISLTDTDYFEDRSWTLSYSFVTQSWTSFHGYKPNFYVSYPTHFHSGLNSNSVVSVWEHETAYSLFNNFYGEISPYTLEYPFASPPVLDEIVSSVQDHCSARIYSSSDIFVEPDEILYFNKAIIRNDHQCTGNLTLIPKNDESLFQSFSYPALFSDRKEILVSKSDGFYQFNDFWNIVKDQSIPFLTQCRVDDICLNQANLDYTLQGLSTGAIRGKHCKIRLTLDDKDNVKLISRFIINNAQKSYK